MATTPGPWRVDPDDATSVLASDDRVTIVACVTGASSNPVTVADAHLIAAAPDLLSALVNVLSAAAYAEAVEASKQSGSTETPAWLRLHAAFASARAAIAKAEGL